jgi:hypothetical protein
MALSHAPQIVSGGLIIYLDANNTSSYAGTGSTWYDLSGNSRHASLISSPSYEGFGRGKYLSFDGSTNYATIPYTITDNLITVSFWYYSKIFSANSSLDALISNFTSGISGFDVRLNSSTTINLAIVIDGSQSQINISTITNNTWYHVAFTYDGATVKTYLDAVFKSSTNVIGTRANGTQICIATSAFDTNRRATCGIPQVMIYNRALSDTEILQNYNATKGRYIVNENIVRNGLVLHLDAGNTRSYAGTGNTAFDIAGTGITASLFNGVAFNNANSGSFVFDGTNDYVEFLPSSIFNLGTGDFTFLAWHKTTNKSGYSTILSIDDGNGTGIIFYTTIGSGVFRNWVAGQARNGNIDICTGIWNLVALTRSSGNCTQFVNGVSDVTFSAAGSLSVSGRSLFVGKILNELYYNGNISQVQIYNRALTSTEIKQNYNALKNRYGLT